MAGNSTTNEPLPDKAVVRDNGTDVPTEIRSFFAPLTERKWRLVTLIIVGIGLSVMVWFTETFSERLLINSVSALYVADELDEKLHLTADTDQQTAIRLLEEQGRAMERRIYPGRFLLPRSAMRTPALVKEAAKSLGATAWGSEGFKRNATKASESLRVAARAEEKLKRYFPILPTPDARPYENSQAKRLLADFQQTLVALEFEHTTERAQECYDRSRLAAAAIFPSLPYIQADETNTILDALRQLAASLSTVSDIQSTRGKSAEKLEAWKNQTLRRAKLIQAMSSRNYAVARTLLVNN